MASQLHFHSSHVTLSDIGSLNFFKSCEKTHLCKTSFSVSFTNSGCLILRCYCFYFIPQNTHLEYHVLPRYLFAFHCMVTLDVLKVSYKLHFFVVVVVVVVVGGGGGGGVVGGVVVVVVVNIWVPVLFE
ncbi:hypothetical protein XENOCAPTIV_020824 [Xenoophorus captivus]|uniref:Transmembrane protein n=1 Tax=Xenoophorus captivus TaxID=1517983 RepID=A0ABV0R9T9_9TELE